MPVKIEFKNSELVLNHREENCNMSPIGTRVVDIASYGSFFSFEENTEFNNDQIWGPNAKSFNLNVNYNKYSTIVVNKIPHGAGNQPPLSHRVTLFLYIVPIDWKNDVELDVTIPALDFLIKNEVDDPELVDLSSLNNSLIQEWKKLLPNLNVYYEGELDRVKLIYENKKKLVELLK